MSISLEQTKTEKLIAYLKGLLDSPVNSNKPTHILVRQILEACKEAGMVLGKNQTFPQIQVSGIIILPEELEGILPNFQAVEEIEI